MAILLSDIMLVVGFIFVFLIGFWIGWDEHENHLEFWNSLNERLFGTKKEQSL